jgi:hypothetical protein
LARNGAKFVNFVNFTRLNVVLLYSGRNQPKVLPSGGVRRQKSPSLIADVLTREC